MNRRLLFGTVAASVLGATAWKASSTEGRPIVVGTSHELPSAILGETRRINVWLPASYGQGDQRYPALYLLDGGEQEDFHHISGLAQISGAYGVTREFIVIGVESGSGRRGHMTFPSTDPKDVEAVPRHGGAASFRRFIGGEVIPWIEDRYRTSPERAIMGESLAGLFVVDTLLKQPDLFDAYIAIDPSLWWDKGSLVRGAAVPDRRRKATPPRLFMAISDQGPAAEADVLAAALGGAVVVTYQPMREETHASIYHPAATRAFRVIFASPPAAAPGG